MNIQRLITMIFRIFLRKIMSRGINAGIDMATRKGGSKAGQTSEDQAQAKSARQMAKKARQGAKITRRMGRM